MNLGLRSVAGVLYRRTFGLWEKLGFHVTRNWYLSPIPDTRLLKDDLWLKRSKLAGIEIREQGQIKLLEEFAHTYKSEYERFPLNPTAIPHQYYVNNGYFGPVDAEILYCMIRHFQPRRIYEVGSGFSTLISAEALLKNEEERPLNAELVAFEPFPNDLLKKGFPGLHRLVQMKIEDVPLDTFQELQENDILFLDSSHIVKTGGDVNFEFLEVLPTLKKGVIIHIHDIFLPSEYPKHLFTTARRFYSEQYLLQAFLAFNTSFEVLWAGSFIHLNRPNLLQAAFPAYDPASCWPGSFWIRRVA